MDLKQLEIINQNNSEERLDALRQLQKTAGNAFPPETLEVNNHVHTTFSFSPYSPSASVWFARKAGLKAVGSMDHDSISAARETLEAGKIIGTATTVGFEMRVNFTGTALEGRKMNNPDSANIVYMTVHGVPESKIDEVAEYLKPIQKLRNERNRKQCEKLSELIAPFALDPIDFDKDVIPLSEAPRGGGITERHILFAFSKSLVKQHGQGQSLIEFLEKTMEIPVKGKIKDFLLDMDNPHYLYDLLGILKGNFLPRFFIQPCENECPSVYKLVDFANSIGAIPCYAYLGDVAESPTGDKKAEKFEDDFLDELVPELKAVGFKGLSYMPPRNTLAQLERVQALCAEHNLMEISGVDINSSRQSFNCPEILKPEFSHLITATWALIAHEKLAAVRDEWSLFHPENPLASLSLKDRIARYAVWGEAMDRQHPESIVELADFQ